MRRAAQVAAASAQAARWVGTLSLDEPTLHHDETAVPPRLFIAGWWSWFALALATDPIVPAELSGDGRVCSCEVGE